MGFLPGATGIFQLDDDKGTTLRLLYDVDKFSPDCQDCKIAISSSPTCDYDDVVADEDPTTCAEYSTDANGMGFGVEEFDIGESLEHFLGKTVLYYDIDENIRACGVIDSADL